jgi:hypothetical protein
MDPQEHHAEMTYDGLCEVAQLAELKAQLSSVSEPNIRVEYKPNRRQYLASVSTN